MEDLFMDTITRDEKLLHAPSGCGVSWSAVIAGALVAFSLSALFNLLNAGLGLVAFPESFHSLSVSAGGYIWLLICSIILMFIAGWVAGKIGKRYCAAVFGVLHGFLAWSLALLLAVFIAGHFARVGAEAADRVQAVSDSRVDAERILDRRDGVRAEQAADVAGTASIGLFCLFLVGAAAACVGGYVGAKNGGNYHSHSDQTRTHTTKY